MKRHLTPLISIMLFALSLQLHAQTVDPSIAPEDLKEQAMAMDAGTELPALADAWLKAVEAKNKDVIEAAKKDGNHEEVAKLESERNSLILRLKVIRDVLKAQNNEDKVKTINARLVILEKTHIDLTDPNALWTKARTWLTDPDGGIRIGLNILAFFVILIIAKILANIAGSVLSRTLSVSKLKISDLLRDFFVNTTRKLIFFGGLVMALGKIGIDTGPLLAGIGVMGFVVGFALQGTLSNFASGIMILLYRPYDIGNVVSAAGATGKVTAMSLVSTTLTTPDNQIVIIPNSSIWGGVITNITGNDTRRVDMTFGIGYDDDIAKAMQILEEIVTSHKLVLKSPAVTIQLHELADSSVNFIVRPWAKTSDYWTVYWDTQRAVKERFDAEGISIPYPQQDVHVHQVGGES